VDPAQKSWSFDKEDIWQVMIRSDFTAEAAFCRNANTSNCETSMQGTWLNYYDQAIMVELENNLRFTANFKYTIKPNITTNPQKEFQKIEKLFRKLDNEGSPPKYHFDSHCDETMIGFLHNMSEPSSFESHPVTCFYGVKDKTQLYEDQVGKNA
jgi:hypothetical protein